jgi:hypothetical protein
MERLEFQRYKEKTDSLPRLSKGVKESYLYLQAWLEPSVKDIYTRIPDSFFRTSADIERLVSESFNLKTIGIDCEVPISEPGPILRYHSLIKPINRSVAEALISITSAHGARIICSHSYPTTAHLRLDLQLPAESYYLNGSKSLVSRLWPLIRGIEFASPVFPPKANKIDFGPGSILLVIDKKPIATGFPCLKKLGLDLPSKDISLIGGESD